MKKNNTSTRPAARSARSWTPPKLIRIEAGRAELTAGTTFDNSNQS
jgi:hypothetical protein